jgi:Arc/MetJ family transcription regulator
MPSRSVRQPAIWGAVTLGYRDGKNELLGHSGWASAARSVRNLLARISVLHCLRYTGSVSKRLVDIDDELLEAASSILGASTMKDTVNRSLEAVVLADRRRRHADRLEAMKGLDLDKPNVMSGAWR